LEAVLKRRVSAVTDDEAFIRAIVAAPGDDAPRLVYADWLDERGDPRGGYLRAEAKSAHLEGLAILAAKERLRELAGGLDPVWAARVSRPPYGVCCTSVRLLESTPAVPARELEELAVRLAIDLPVEYRAFLLNWNGGTPDPNHLQIGLTREPGEYAEVERFFSVYPPTVGTASEGWLDDLEESARVLRGSTFPNNAIENYLPIATAGDDNYLLLGIREPVLGEVEYVAGYTRDSTAAPGIRDVAPTFAWFLALLKDHDPEWARLIWAGKLTQFVRWLDLGGDPDAFSPRTGESAVEVAACSEQWELVAELLRRGANVPEAVRERLERSGPPSVRQLARTPPTVIA
jgi:uncharacterized protein (TIGR02996 family)